MIHPDAAKVAPCSSGARLSNSVLDGTEITKPKLDAIVARWRDELKLFGEFAVQTPLADRLAMGGAK